MKIFLSGIIILVLLSVVLIVLYKRNVLTESMANIVITVALGILVLVVTTISNQAIESIKLNQNKEIYQYTLNNQASTDFLKNYYLGTQFMGELSSEYGTSNIDEIAKKWTAKEREKYNNNVSNF